MKKLVGYKIISNVTYDGELYYTLMLKYDYTFLGKTFRYETYFYISSGSPVYNSIKKFSSMLQARKFAERLLKNYNEDGKVILDVTRD